MLRVLFTLVFIALTTSSYSQFKMERFGVAQGLSQSQITSLAEDSLGYLWIGTGGGLSRFDGASFDNYSITNGLSNNFIWDLLVVKNDLWLSTQTSLSHFDGNEFKNYSLPTNENGQLSKVFCYNDSIYIQFSNGKLGKVHNQSVTYIKKHTFFSSIQKVVKVKGHTVVFQNDCAKSELVILKDHEVQKLNTTNLFSQLYSAFFHSKILFISTNNGLFQLNGNRLVLQYKHDFPIYQYDSIREMYLGIKDQYLVGVSKNKPITSLDAVNSVVNTDLIDKEGTLWLGADRGLIKIFSQPFEKVNLPNWENEPVMGMAEYQGNLWVGSVSRGIKVYSNNQLLKEIDFHTRNKNLIFYIGEDNKQKFFVGTNEGLCTIQGDNTTWIVPSIIESTFDAVFDSSNVGYFGSARKGLYVLGKDGAVKSIRELWNTPVYSLLYNTHDNSILAGTDIGLWKITGLNAHKIDLPDLDGVQIVSIDWIDSNSIIIGTTGKGVFFYSFDGKITNLNVSKGLASNTCYFVRKEKNEKGIWVGTERGIDYIDLDYTNLSIKNIVHFTEKDGLTGLETNKDSFLKYKGQLYFGLIDGLYRFQGSQEYFKPISLPLHIDQITITKNNGDPNGGVRVIKQINPLELSNSENRISFTFNKINKRNPTNYYYRFKLDGQDEIWSAHSSIKTATYSNLKPGHYNFLIEVTDKSGSFKFDTLQLPFVIYPAFYQTTLFKTILSILLIGLIVVVAYTYNKVKFKKKFAEHESKIAEQATIRKEIARDFHDDLGNQMARMINYVGLLKIKNKLEQGPYETLSNYSQQILSGTKDFVWALDPSNDELNNLIIHLKDFGERMFYEKNIDFSFHGNLPEHLKLPLGYSRQVNLIFKEAMTNAFKHSNATQVELYLAIDKRKIQIKLQDNGVGILPNVLELAERGMDNMKTRAKRIDGNLRISSNGNGTLVELEIILD